MLKRQFIPSTTTASRPTLFLSLRHTPVKNVVFLHTHAARRGPASAYSCSTGQGGKRSLLRLAPQRGAAGEGDVLVPLPPRWSGTLLHRDVYRLFSYSTWQYTSDSTTAPRIISHSSAIATDQPCQRSRYYSPYTAQALFSTAVLYAIQRAVPDPEDPLFKALCSSSN